VTTLASESQAVRERLDHPVIDTDGHVQEYLPAVYPYLREALGPDLFERYRKGAERFQHILGGDDPETRVLTRTPQSAWWGTPARNTRDLATAVIPGLLYERMDELGFDYSVLYPTKALGIAGVDDPEMRQGLCRGFNTFLAETFRPYADRLTAGGVIPMHTPDEAVAEIEHCHELGIKVVGIPEGVLRRIPRPMAEHASPWLLPGQEHWFDTFGLDSEHDYDPVWAKMVERGFAVTCHGGLGDIFPFTFTSVSSYVSNHIGFFAERMQKVCKSLFMGGVTRRFPTLNIAFLECGVGWASSLLVDLVEHWEKRNVEALRANLDPALVDWDEFEGLMERYGRQLTDGADAGDTWRQSIRSIPAVGVEPADVDEFRFAEITQKSDIRDLFVPRFFFGCEADDRTIAFAFSKANAFGARLQPVFSSDISHWDVEDMAGVLAEAHGLVTKGLLTDDDFADLTFRNPARLFTQGDPGFFDGTAVEPFITDEVRGRAPVPAAT
jgi:predicted TIM-barrel fold metal-dependent hydrolase